MTMILVYKFIQNQIQTHIYIYTHIISKSIEIIIHNIPNET